MARDGAMVRASGFRWAGVTVPPVKALQPEPAVACAVGQRPLAFGGRLSFRGGGGRLGRVREMDASSK